jgi:hypothetical protein
MVGSTRSHSEERWALLPETIVRCNDTRPNGGRCKREAEPGAVVCDQHGGAAPQVRRRAAERLIMTADRAAENLVRMMEDTEVPFGVRAKIAQDLLDRAGVIATQVHQIIPTMEDPLMRFFEDAFSDPRNWEENPVAGAGAQFLVSGQQRLYARGAHAHGRARGREFTSPPGVEDPSEDSGHADRASPKYLTYILFLSFNYHGRREAGFCFLW